MQTIQSKFLFQHVCKPTRFCSRQEPSILDLIITNEKGMVDNLNHNPGLGDSDHECLNSKVNCYVDKTKEKHYHFFTKEITMPLEIDYHVLTGI